LESGSRGARLLTSSTFSFPAGAGTSRVEQTDAVACWAHPGGKFYEAQSIDLMDSKVRLDFINLLNDVEREARDRQRTSQ
jgi:hypothetical protein